MGDLMTILDGWMGRPVRHALVAAAGILPLTGTPLLPAGALAPRAAMAGRTLEAGTAAAVVVNPENAVQGLKLRELRSFLRLERQFWPNGKRCVLYLPPSGAPSKRILLERIYRMSDEELRRYWMGKIFAGEIPALPSVARTAKAAGKVVQKSQDALAVVLATEVPEGLRVLSIDGTLPGDPAYPLVAPPAP